MRIVRCTIVVAAAFAAAIASGPAIDAQAARQVPLYQQFLSPPTPLEIVAAKKVDRVAWMAYDEGKRNV